MPKSTITYWNALNPESEGKWTPVKGLEGMLEELTLSMDDLAITMSRKTSDNKRQFGL